MRFSLPKIYPITDTRLSGLSHLEQVKRLVDGGATVIQLRDKTATPAEFLESAVQVIDYARPLGVKIIINDRVDIALAAGADGVHLGQDDLPPRKAREVLGGKAIIGFSTHTIEQAVAALAFPVDYVAFGPIFATGTKENPDAVVGLEMLAQVRKLLRDKPLVAIGGITADDIFAVLTASADSAAIISDIVRGGQNIAQNLRKLAKIVDKMPNIIKHS